MVWGDALPPSPFRKWLCYAHLGYNHTTLAVHHTLNHTGDALALTAQPFHEDIRILGSMLGLVPFHVLVFFHGLYTAANIRPLPFRPYWLLCFWISLMSGYGGGTLTNLMLQEPFLWCRDNLVLPLFAAAWWLIMYCPGDMGYKVFNVPLVKLICRSSAAVLRARVIASRLELSVLKFSADTLVAPLFFGTLGGCAGKLTVDFVLQFFSPGQRPPEVLYPGWFLRSAFLISLWYMWSVHWLHILPQDVAFVMVVTSLVAHGIMEEVLGHPVDLTAPIGRAFHTISRIPEPPPRAKASQPPPSKSAKTRKNGEYKKKVA